MKKIFSFFTLLVMISVQVFSQWTIQYNPPTAQTSMVIRFFNDNTGYYSGILYNSSTMNIYKTTNGGVNFTAQNSNYTAQRFMCMYMVHPDTVFMAGNYSKLLRTVNGGNNWVNIYPFGDTLYQFWGMQFVNSNTGYIVSSYGRIIKTTNKGDNWTLNYTATLQNALDGIWFVNENTGYVSGSNIVLKTTDAGGSWVTKPASFFSGFETAGALYFSDANTGVYGTNGGRIVRTTNGGDNWTEVYNVAGTAVWGISFPNALTGYGCTSDGKALRTNDAGATWSTQTTPLTENLYEIYFPSALTGYIAAWSGKVLKTTNGGLTYINQTSTEVPNNYALAQNYPNPFNPSTKINFDIAKQGYTELKVYDAAGREIITLVNTELKAGTYEVTYNPFTISSGIYYYRISVNGYSETRKMIFVK